MKTVMQELIEILEDKNHLSNPRNNQDDIDTYLHCIDEAKKLLQKEKEQICNAYTDGLEGPYIGAEEYYYDLYNQFIKKITITEFNQNK
jgi:hypothetical protein